MALPPIHEVQYVEPLEVAQENGTGIECGIECMGDLNRKGAAGFCPDGLGNGTGEARE